MNIRDYDSQEYAYYVTSDLTPGTYYFYYNAKLDYSANNSYLKFTIEDGVTVPAGAFLYGESTSSVKFISKDETEIYWSGKLSMAGASTIPEDAIILGEINYYSGLSSGGNQYYKNADIRCFLNGEDSTLSNWAPTNELDRAPEYLNDPGFLYQIDSDFRDVLGSVKKRVFHLETNEVEEIDDLIFLPTSSELYGAYIVNRQGEEVNLGDP